MSGNAMDALLKRVAHMSVDRFSCLLPCLHCLLHSLPPMWLCGCACGRSFYIHQAKRWARHNMDLELDMEDLTYSIKSSEPLLIEVEVLGLRLFSPTEWNEVAGEEAVVVPELHCVFRRGLDNDARERLCLDVTVGGGVTVVYDARNAFLTETNFDCIISHIQDSKFGREQAAKEAAEKAAEEAAEQERAAAEAAEGLSPPLLPAEGRPPLLHLTAVTLRGDTWIRLQQNGQKSVLPDIQVPEFELSPSEVNSPVKLASFINGLVAREIGKFLVQQGQGLVDMGGAIGVAVVAACSGSVEHTTKGADTIGASLTHNHRVHPLRGKNRRSKVTSPIASPGGSPVLSPRQSFERPPV
mmetsp:Transcript_28597/g.71691  ORF Transcript_28597/g.71691 Transcript_28597/m.71691 type:complete len:355 (+) Transcript_28597:317-1381(+)|eukprot:jgi/Tetstr1/429360/TSEL_019277.t1